MIHKSKLQYNTVKPQLRKILSELMEEPLFSPFVLVGGTNLSLRLGHRMSDDIDLFTDDEYGSIDFNELETYLSWRYPYYDKPNNSSTAVGFGNSYYIGDNKDNCIKLDLMYADAPYFEKFEIVDKIRMATERQIAAMKIEAINTGGRKKDWWDIHELLSKYSLKQLLQFHEKWEEWTHDEKVLLDKLIIFDRADLEPDPKCLKGKDWDIIKMDIIKNVQELKEGNKKNITTNIKK